MSDLPTKANSRSSYSIKCNVNRKIMSTVKSLELLIDSKEITNEFSVTGKLIECFKPRYRLRRVKNKGAILVIAWSFLVSPTYIYISHMGSVSYSSSIFVILQAIVGFTLPIAGWLADVRFGRYKVIRVSLWLM